MNQLLIGSSLFQRKRQKSGDIRPRNILINDMGHVNIINHLSFPDEISNYYKSLLYKVPTFLCIFFSKYFSSWITGITVKQSQILQIGSCNRRVLFYWPDYHGCCLIIWLWGSLWRQICSFQELSLQWQSSCIQKFEYESIFHKNRSQFVVSQKFWPTQSWLNFGNFKTLLKLNFVASIICSR